jgi:hypothetical protein
MPRLRAVLALGDGGHFVTLTFWRAQPLRASVPARAPRFLASAPEAGLQLDQQRRGRLIGELHDTLPDRLQVGAGHVDLDVIGRRLRESSARNAERE